MTSSQPEPSDSAPHTLVIKLTCGGERPEVANQAFSVAATAVASGAQVSLWLTGEATWFALPGRAQGLTLAHAAPLEELLDSVLTGGSLTVCSQCAVRRNIWSDDVVTGARIAGSSAFVEEIMQPGVQAVVY